MNMQNFWLGDKAPGAYIIDQLAHPFAHRVGPIIWVRGRWEMQVEFLARQRDGVAVEIGEVCRGLEINFTVV
jgi:hypothetical protein